ncbi:hypothetical protein GCM10022249_03170 [Enteractinococcus coprophilus]
MRVVVVFNPLHINHPDFGTDWRVRGHFGSRLASKKSGNPAAADRMAKQLHAHLLWSRLGPEF